MLWIIPENEHVAVALDDAGVIKNAFFSFG